MKRTLPRTQCARKSWGHFSHQADIGIRGIGATKEQAFEQSATASTAIITEVNSLEPQTQVEVACDAPDDELLFVDWLNAIVYEMATNNMLLCPFEVLIEGVRLRGNLWEQPINGLKHELATV